MIMNEDFLQTLREEPRPEFAAALYQRIHKPMQTHASYPALRVAALTLSVLILLSASLLLSPSARALADDILHRVGGYIFTKEVVDQGPKASSTGAIIRTPGSVSITSKAGALAASEPAAAGKLAGFPVLAPAALPAGYTAMTSWTVTSDDTGVTVSRGYRDAANNFLIINELKTAPGVAAQAFHRDQIVDVSVRGHSGVWLPDPASPDGKNALVWDENGVTYSVLSNS